MSEHRFASELERLQAIERELRVALRVIAHMVEAECPEGRYEVPVEYLSTAPDLTAWREDGRIILTVSRSP